MESMFVIIYCGLLSLFVTDISLWLDIQNSRNQLVDRSQCISW